MLRATSSELRARTEEFAIRAGHVATPVELKSVVGGGSAPESFLASWGVALEFSGLSATALEQCLRSSNPPVIVRIEQGRVILDFRTIFPAEEEDLLRIVQGLEIRKERATKGT